MTASPFTSTYRPTFTRTYQVKGDLRDLVSANACEAWRANRLVEDLDPVLAAHWVSLQIEYLVVEGHPDICFDWELQLEDLGGRQLAQVEAEEYLTPHFDTGDYVLGGPSVHGSVNGRVRSVAALRDELRRFLPAGIVRELAGINVLGPWVAESLARTWAWLEGHGAFDAPAEVLASAWEQAVEEVQPPVEVQPLVEDSYGWITQSQQCWDDFLHDRITAAGLEDGDVPLDHARQPLLRLLAPLAEPYGVTLGQDGDFLIRDGADENAAREVCRRALTTEVVAEAIHNAPIQPARPVCCILHAWIPGACSTHTIQEAGGAVLPPVEVAEHHPEVRDVLDGLDLLPGENRRFAAAWRSVTARHAENVSCQGIAPVPDSNDWLVRWASQGGYSSRRQWVVEFRLTPVRYDGEGPLYATSMTIRTSSRDGSGRYVLPEIKTRDTCLVEEAFRRRLIAEGAYQLALDAIDQGREDEVWRGIGGEPYVDCTYEEALARGLELLHEGGFPTPPADPAD